MRAKRRKVAVIGTALIDTASALVSLDASDPSPMDVAQGFRYSFGTDPGDLETAYNGPNTQADPTRTFTFMTARTYTVHGRVLDYHAGDTPSVGDGNADYTTSVSVVRPSLSVAVAGSYEEDIATLTGAIANPQGSPLNLTVNWNDGQQATYQIAPNVTTFTIGHYYESVGNYSVVLTAGNDATPLATTTAVVSAAAPQADVVQYAPTQNNGLTFHLLADVYNLPDSPNLTYNWGLVDDYGNGYPAATGQSATFDYTIPNPSHSYHIVLTIYNIGGQSSDFEQEVYGPNAWTFPSQQADDPTVSISETDPSQTVQEGSGADFQFTLANAVDHPVTVFYTTADGTADANRDYMPVLGEAAATISAHSLTSSTIDVATIVGTPSPASRTFTAQLGPNQASPAWFFGRVLAVA